MPRVSPEVAPNSNQPERKSRNTTRDSIRTFLTVLKSYAELAQFPRIAAQNYDAGAKAPHKWSVHSAHYLADVELTTKRILTSPELYGQWCELVRREAGLDFTPVSAETESRIAKAVSRAYEKKHLNNIEWYFHTVKKRAVE